MTLPAIIAVLDKRDSGEYGNASCPHCAADGRYVYEFVCADGTTRGAMAGCIKLFPRDAIANATQLAFDAETKARRDGSFLASWHSIIADAVRSFAAGRISLNELRTIVSRENARKRAYVARRYGR